MNKKRYILCIFVILILQSTCSFNYQYLIINASNAPLTIEYRFRAYSEIDGENRNNYPKEGRFYFAPKMLSRDELSNKNAEWQKVVESGLQENEKTGELKLTLQSEGVLKIYQDRGNALKSEGSNFPIGALSLNGNKGRILVEEKLVFKQFSKLSGTTYQFRYE